MAAVPPGLAERGSPLPLAEAGPSPRDASPAVTRISHPANGSFDVVITQGAARNDLPDLTGILSGNPVYTVYLRVGDEKEWLLEYCLPTRANSRPNPYQVDIGNATGISPPYPLVTVIPNSLLELPHPKHIILQGVLTAAGALAEVRPLGTSGAASDALARQIASLLSQWQFRPAMQDEAFDWLERWM